MHDRLAVVVVGAVLTALSGCGSGSGESIRVPGAAATTEPTATTTASTLPGEPFDVGFWRAGAVLDVAGIAFDETLSVHALPGNNQSVVGELPPLARGIVSTGNARLLETAIDGIWLQVTAEGVTGWVVANRMVYLGGPRDVTADVVSATGATPRAASMLELGQVVTDALVPTDPASLPTIVVASAPGAGPTSEVIYDTFPGEFFGDDTAVGQRLVVTGRQVASGDLPQTAFASASGYELVSVTAIELCTRGATDDGLCV